MAAMRGVRSFEMNLRPQTLNVSTESVVGGDEGVVMSYNEIKGSACCASPLFKNPQSQSTPRSESLLSNPRCKYTIMCPQTPSQASEET